MSKLHSESSNNVSLMSSPFEEYLHPTEFNALDFVPKLSSERNYHKWKHFMWHFIERQGLIGLIGEETTAKRDKDGTVREESSASACSQDSGGSGTVKEETAINDGTAAAAMEKETANDANKSWKISDIRVQGWILTTLSEDTRLRILGCKTAKQMWTELKEIFDPTSFTSKYDEETDGRVARYAPFYKAIVEGNISETIRIIDSDPGAVTAAITPGRETALHVAIKTVGRIVLVRILLEKMTPNQNVVGLVNSHGDTALHYAATFNNYEGAEMLVRQNYPDLPKALNQDGLTALHLAARYGLDKMFRYLEEWTGEDALLPVDVGFDLLLALIQGDFYDKALTFLQRRPELARPRPGQYGIHGSPLCLWRVICSKYSSSLPSETSLNFWPKIIYSVSRINDIKKQKQRRHLRELVKLLCAEVAKLKPSEEERIYEPVMATATRIGLSEIVEEIVRSSPLWMTYFDNVNDQSIFHRAILWRHERLFNFMKDRHAGYVLAVRDRFKNNGLHMAALLGDENQYNIKASATGAVLQMQREWQWFKEVENLTPPNEKEARNADGKTPAQVFHDTHQDLVKEGEQWMKDTATSCTIVAALIATIVFAAAITIPGGNNGDNGFTMLSKKKAFKIFGISNALALFSSTTSVLMFLLILTSRYAIKDFQHTLPTRLIIGLITLFVSVLSMMVAFGAILYLVFGDNKAWILIPIVALVSFPTTLFGAWQLPLLAEMIQSTYGRGIFGKKSDRVLW